MKGDIFRNVTLVLALAIAQGGRIMAQTEDATKSTPPQRTTSSRSELRDKQLDAALEARDIERILAKLKRASDLSKQRIADAAKTAESASSALDRGDSKSARQDAAQAAEMFREIARQLEALLAEETPPRIAAARDLANRLAQIERQFAQDFQGMLNPTRERKSKDGAGGEMTEEERREAVAKMAERIARSGQTLQDILKPVTQSTDPADKAAIGQVEAALKETDLDKIVEMMRPLAADIRAGKLDDVRGQSLDIAERLEVTGQKLEAIFRVIVAPKVQELRELEEALATHWATTIRRQSLILDPHEIIHVPGLTVGIPLATVRRQSRIVLFGRAIMLSHSRIESSAAQPLERAPC